MSGVKNCRVGPKKYVLGLVETQVFFLGVTAMSLQYLRKAHLSAQDMLN